MIARSIRDTLFVATAWVTITAAPAHADDIELFVSTDNQPFQCEAPNVLFLIDTSGSMSSEVLTQDAWDPEQTYAGCYETGDYYFSATGTPPDCGSGTNFRKSANACSVILNTEYTGLFQSWNPSNEIWAKLTDGDSDWTVECSADEGLHGDGIGSATYAVDGPAGPWSDEPANRIAWGANASSVTIYDGNWLNWLANPPTTTMTRLEIAQEVTIAALDNMTNINVALIEFNESNGGSVRQPIEPISTARESLQQIIAGFVPDGVTPLSESLYELTQYLRGGNIEFGKPNTGESVAASRVGNSLDSGTYLSPLNSPGQNNYIVMVSDGDLSQDKSANSEIEALPGYGTLVGDPCDDEVDGSCLDSLAEYLNKADLRADVPGIQNVVTHTIGFDNNQPLLASTAERGGGKYYVADNTASLTAALSNLTADFARTASLLTSPQIPIDAFNQADRLDNVYVSVFEAAATQHWPGNLKHYRLQESGGATILIDANGKNVIDPTSGLFRDDAVSFWSAPTVDGVDIKLGGAASQLPPSATRRLYSNVRGNGLEELTVANANVTAALVGAPEEEREVTIDWARGLDSRDADEDGITLEQRLSLGDPLHVQPVTVTYGADAENSNAVVFVSTNDGYLHAIDATNGVEIWSFIPRRLLSRLFELSLEDTAANKEYGLDGELRVIEVANRKILIFGMRRGGDAIFAMDVTNRTSPTLLWVRDSNHPDFLDLGQTWSPVTAARIEIGGTTKDVLLFGGGYDAGQDNGAFRIDSKGNAIYMVNTLTGALEWSAGNPDGRSNHDLELPRMLFSIPAQLRVLDNDRDGLTDRVYVGDMGAQLWRIDIVNGRGRTTLGEGGVIASLSESGRVNARRFYNPPDVVDVIQDEKVYTAINIGSGFRAHPLDTETAEEFYSIRDFHSQVVIPTEDYGTAALPVVTRADLNDVTNNVNFVMEPTDAGWLLRLEGAGEKVLSSSLTISNVLFFTSFIPSGINTTCLPGGGQNRLYRVSVLNGAALTNLDGSLDPDDFTREDRFVDVGQLQDVPLAVMPGPDGPCAGLDCFDGENEFGDSGGGDGEDGGAGGLAGPRANETYWLPITRP